MYRFIRKLHLWFSLPFGVLISIICFSGMLLLFEPHHAPGTERPDFFLQMMRLHRWLLDAPAEKGAMSIGKLIVGISVIAMCLILVSGIILWCQHARRGIWKSLRISLTNGWRRFLTDLHISGGIWVAIILLVLAVTGLTWSFGWWREWVATLFGIEKGSRIIYSIHSGNIGGVATKIIWGICSFIGFTLPITGYHMWIHRIALRRNKQPK